MFDIGWSELLILAAVAIIFVGPKDLPRMMRTVGQYVSKARAMAREFQSSFEDLARETELQELRKEVANIKAQASEPFLAIDKEMNKPLATGAAKAAQKSVAPADAVQAGDEKPAALDTGGLSPEMAEAIREAEAVSGFGAGDDDGEGDLAKAKPAAEPGQIDPDTGTDSAKAGRDSE